MSSRAVIVLEGSEYVGKTSVGHILQKLIPNHAYIKLSQPNNLAGRERINALVQTFAQTAKLCELMDNHVLVDRFTTSERVYGPIYHGFDKDIYWRFNHIEHRLNSLGAYHFLLCAKETAFIERWKAKVTAFPNEVHVSPAEALKIQEAYIAALEDIRYDKDRIYTIDTTTQTPETIAKTIIKASGLVHLLRKDGVVSNAP